jgi:hypothetical protein
MDRDAYGVRLGLDPLTGFVRGRAYPSDRRTVRCDTADEGRNKLILNVARFDPGAQLSPQRHGRFTP